MEQSYPDSLRITAYDWKPQIWVNLNTSLSIEGPMSDFLNYFTRSLNLSYILIAPIEEESGTYNTSTDNWTGMMGMISRNVVHTSLTPLLITIDRSSYVSFSNLMFMGIVRILVGRPQKSKSLSGLIAAFTAKVWMALGFIFSLVLFLKILIRCSLSEDESFCKMLGEQLWQVYSGLILKSIVKLPRSISGRIITGFWILLALVLVNFYCARMTSLLAFYKEKPFIYKLEDMKNFPDVRPLLHKGSNEVDYFKQPWESGAQLEVKRRLRPEFLLHSDELYSDPILDMIENCEAVILQEGRVFEVVLSERYKRRESCRYRLGLPYRSIPVGLAFHKNINRRFLEDMNRRISSFCEASMMDYIYPPRIKIGLNQCFASNDEVSGVFNPLPLVDIQTAIMIWVGGILLSIFALLIEEVFYFCAF